MTTASNTTDLKINTTSALNIAVLSGGKSAEADVSRSSAKGVIAALRQHSNYVVTSIDLNETVTQQLSALQPDVVFPALHGPPGEDGTVQGMLEMLGLPYVGSGVQPSAFAMDKAVAKALFRRANLPVARDLVYRSNPNETDLGAAKIASDIEAHMGDKVVIKPMQQGSALGVTPMPNGGDLNAAVAAALALGEQILVEPFIAGREITVGVLDLFGQQAIPHPVIEILTGDDEWYDYNNRYAQGASKHVVPAQMDDCLLYTSPSPRDRQKSRMPSSA